MPVNQNDHTISKPVFTNPIFVTGGNIERLPTGSFHANYIPEINGERLIKPGLIVARLGAADNYKYVPADTSANYGTGSDTAVGIIPELVDGTLGDPQVSPVVMAHVVESRCYTYTASEGPSNWKSDLTKILWR